MFSFTRNTYLFPTLDFVFLRHKFEWVPTLIISLWSLFSIWNIRNMNKIISTVQQTKTQLEYFPDDKIISCIHVMLFLCVVLIHNTNLNVSAATKNHTSCLFSQKQSKINRPRYVLPHERLLTWPYKSYWVTLNWHIEVINQKGNTVREEVLTSHLTSVGTKCFQKS